MKIILPLAMTTMLGFAAVSGMASAATTTTPARATTTATAMPAAHPMSKAACTKEATARKLSGEALHKFVKECRAGEQAPSAPQAK